MFQSCRSLILASSNDWSWNLRSSSYYRILSSALRLCDSCRFVALGGLSFRARGAGSSVGIGLPSFHGRAAEHGIPAGQG